MSQDVTITTVDMDEVVTAVARLLCNARVTTSDIDRKSFKAAAEEFAVIFGIDRPRIVERAKLRKTRLTGKHRAMILEAIRKAEDR